MWRESPQNYVKNHKQNKSSITYNISDCTAMSGKRESGCLSICWTQQNSQFSIADLDDLHTIVWSCIIILSFFRGRQTSNDRSWDIKLEEKRQLQPKIQFIYAGTAEIALYLNACIWPNIQAIIPTSTKDGYCLLFLQFLFRSMTWYLIVFVASTLPSVLAFVY